MIRLAALLTLIAAPAAADLQLRFIEGAPKDRFVLTGSAGCATGPIQVVIDLSESAGGLIFDTTGTGAGVEVFQPLEFVEGAALLTGTPELEDGATQLTLDLSDLAPGQVLSFTTDLDDTLGARAITVSGAEIAGATFQAGNLRTTIGADATAALPVCQS